MDGSTEQAATHAEILASLRDLQAENEQLRRRIRELERTLDQDKPGNAVADGARSATDPVANDSSAESKLALYQSLFRGREDVHAVRWEGTDGRQGYSPALRFGAARGRGVKHEPDDYLPLTSNVIRRHLMGETAIGVYPLLRDDTCWLVAIDFDKEGWEKDVLAAADACDSLGIPVAVERSRSGHGARLWIFFSIPVPASLARNLGSVVLTKALDRRYQIGLDSYDRLFPSQDTLPARGFGNLIALPLQGERRRQENTVFLDRSLTPFPDQWRFLSAIRRLEPSAAESIVRDAARTGDVVGLGAAWFDEEDGGEPPWSLPPSRRRAPETPIPGLLLTSVSVVLSNWLFIPKDGLPPLLINQLRRLAAFQNPEFYRAQALRMSTREKPRLIDCSEDFPSISPCRGAASLRCASSSSATRSR
jgi:hypothetical protein